MHIFQILLQNESSLTKYYQKLKIHNMATICLMQDIKALLAKSGNKKEFAELPDQIRNSR